MLATIIEGSGIARITLASALRISLIPLSLTGRIAGVDSPCELIFKL